MKRVLLLVLLSMPMFAQEVTVYATGGKSITTWHGQADMQGLHVELARPLSPRLDVTFAVGAVNLWQPRSWFGNQFGDGHESVRGAAVTVLVRRRFYTNARLLSPYVEGGTGPMVAEKQVPASTSRFNFVSQGGAGVVLAPQSRLPLVVGYRFQHISNGGYSPRNPGLNMSSLVLGLRIRTATTRRR